MSLMHFLKTDTVKKEKSMSAPVLIDIERMKSALSADRFTMPKGLSREEKRKFILAAGEK
jgi:hypothetical protein